MHDIIVFNFQKNFLGSNLARANQLFIIVSFFVISMNNFTSLSFSALNNNYQSTLDTPRAEE